MSEEGVRLYRKRIIPDECILLKDDIVLFRSKEMIITKWNTLKPKKVLHHGYSCYFPERGFKVSKFYDHNDQLISWYCDIVSHTYDAETDTYVFTDLLVDVIVYPDGFVRVVDLDELADALRDGKMTPQQLQLTLRHLDKLLGIIYKGEFERLQKYINDQEEADRAASGQNGTAPGQAGAAGSAADQAGAAPGQAGAASDQAGAAPASGDADATGDAAPSSGSSSQR